MDDYFNYFTEIERYYQSRRESFTLLSTLDWVLIETWKDQGVPLEVVLKGMDRAFSRAKRKISSLAYCANAVSQVAEEQKDMRIGTPDLPELPPHVQSPDPVWQIGHGRHPASPATGRGSHPCSPGH